MEFKTKVELLAATSSYRSWSKILVLANAGRGFLCALHILIIMWFVCTVECLFVMKIVKNKCIE